MSGNSSNYHWDPSGAGPAGGLGAWTKQGGVGDAAKVHQVNSTGGGAAFSPFTANIGVPTLTGVAHPISNSAMTLRFAVVTGSANDVYIGFGIGSADALSNVDATGSSEKGMLLTGTAALGDAIVVEIPSGADYYAVAENGTQAVVFNVTQGG